MGELYIHVLLVTGELVDHKGPLLAATFIRHEALIDEVPGHMREGSLVNDERIETLQARLTSVEHWRIVEAPLLQQLRDPQWQIRRLITCYKCGKRGHCKSECSRLKNQNFDDQKGNEGKAQGDLTAWHIMLMLKERPSRLANGCVLALADLGVSINLMLFSVWEALSLPKLTPTCMTLELADRSVSKPISIAKDVSFKVGVFQFPADFVVVDFEPDPRVPLILERCFLKTSRALIDVHKGELTLRIEKEAITYNLDQTASDFLLFEEADAFLGLEDDPDLPKINPFYYDPEGDILLLEAILNSEPSPPLPNHEQYFPSYKKELKVCEAKTVKSSIDEPHEVELKDLPPHLEYAFLEGDNKLPVIIAKELGDEKKSAPIKVLKSHKRAIAWKLSDIQGGFTVVENEENELILTRLVTGWRVCIDYRKLNEATRKDHFHLPFMDQMLERLARNEYYCFLDGFSGYFQIPNDPRDQEKTTFTCPYGTFAYRRMPFGLCNAPGTFQR
nr:hypothetical protein [Tanacetum cinerariifolium]